MKKSLVKVIAVAVAMFMLASMLAGCGSTATHEPEPYLGAEDAPNYDGIYEYSIPYGITLCYFGRPLYEFGPDGELRPTTAGFTEVPIDLHGRNVHVVTANLLHFTYWDDIDATPNETLAIIGQLRAIEQDYNMTFSFEYAPRGGGASQILLSARLAGETPNDIFNINVFHHPPDWLFPYGLLMNLNHPSVANIIDFENNPWHYGSAMATLFGAQYGVHFPTANSGEMLGSMLTFNRDHMETFDLGNFYEMVFTHTWNFTNFERILRQIHIESEGTIMPLVSHREQFIGPGFIFANGGSIINNTPEGMVFVGSTCDQALEAMQFMARLAFEDLLVILPGTHPGGPTIYEMLRYAADGEILFMSGEFELLRRLTRQQVPSNFSFGLLPTPMGNHMHDYVAAMIRYDMFHIVQDIPNPQEVAAILVAMANRLTKLNVVEHELHYGVQDEYSAEILAMMLERQIIDYSRMISTRNSVTNSIVSVINGFSTPVQAMQMAELQINNTLNNLNRTLP